MAALVLAVLAALAAVFTARVQGGSMSPTIRDGDDLLVDKIGVQFRPLARGDIVVATEGDAALVKRVIAIPGDVVEIDTVGGRPAVLIDGPSRDSDSGQAVLGVPWAAGDLSVDRERVGTG